MNHLHTFLVLVLLTFSLNSFPQTYTNRQVRVAYLSSQNTMIDEIVIAFSENPTVTIEENRYWDARTLNTGTYLASLKGTAALAIQTRPLNFETDTVSMLVASLQPNTFKLNFTGLPSFIEAREVWLYDAFLGQQQNLKLNPLYNFSITSDTASQGRNRFKLVLLAEQFVVRCPANITVNNMPGRDGAYVNFESKVVSKCGNYFLNYSKLPNSYFSIGSTSVNVDASDVCGNAYSCSFTVTVKDVEPPIFSSVNSISLFTDTGRSYTYFTPSTPNAVDNSLALTITGTRSDRKALTDAYPKGRTTITWTAVDASGNSSTINQLITVYDLEPPVFSERFSGQLDLTIDGCDNAELNAYYDPEVNDNCYAYTLTNSLNGGPSLQGIILPKGTTTITWTATDASNNISTIQQVITVADKTAPSIIGKLLQDEYAPNFSGCTYKVAGVEMDPDVTDNCSEIMIINDFNNLSTLDGAILPLGSTTINWTATDADGNVATWQDVITVTSNLSASIPDAQALLKGVRSNTIYIGYTPASTINYSANATGADIYSWATSQAGLSIVGANNGSTIKISASNTAGGQLILTAKNAAGCTASAIKNIRVVDVRCGAKLDKVLLCSPQRKESCVNNNSGVQTSLNSGFTLGSCASTAARSQNIDQVIYQPELSISAYPNPTKGAFMLQLNGYESTSVEVSIIDMLGRTVAVKSLDITQQKEQITFDLSCRSAGVYNVRVSTADGVQQTKVVLAQ